MARFCSSSTLTPSLEKKSSSSSFEKAGPLVEELNGTHKVKYHAGEEWDLAVATTHNPIDMSLVLPHYRARHQPVHHRMSMYIESDNGPVKTKVCRQLTQSRFYLEIQAETSEVTVWLPSDFKGHIHHSGKASFSDGFVNHIMRNVDINEESFDDSVVDEVVISTRGHIWFRMWDVNTCAPESKRKEVWKKMFRCTRKTPETTFDWDYLLED